MYNDEEEDEEEEEQNQNLQRQQQQQGDGESNDQIQQETDEFQLGTIAESLPDPSPSRSPQNLSSPSPEIKALRSPTPPPWPKSQLTSPLNVTSRSPTPPPLRPPPPEPVLNGERGRVGLTIVDYEHDDVAMSPEAEEGEIVSSGGVVVNMLTQSSEENFEERTPPGIVQLLTPSTQLEPPPQPSELPDQSETSMAIDSTGTEPEVAQVELAAVVFEEAQKEDPLKSFLPPPVTSKCPEELQEKINKFLAYKKAGKSFNEALRNRKDYRNPDFLQHAVRYQDIDQIGTCFNKDVFDPHGYDRSDYFDEIEADMKREMERKEQERKKSPKVDFLSGGTQPATVAPVLKIGPQIPVAGISASLTSGLPPIATVTDATRENRQNKKTKWDKIDGDVKNPSHSGAHDHLSAVGVHAAHLSAANAGTGYTAFAQQKRREAEERRSGERRSDKRS